MLLDIKKASSRRIPNMQEILNQLIDASFDRLVKDTQELVSINSVLDESTAGEGAPFGKGIRETLELILEKGKEMNMETKNCDGYAGHIQLGESGELMAILAHMDVVPAAGQWTFDPYSAVVSDGKLYGRGAVDDKGPAMACLYAMKAIKDSGLPVSRRVRLILGTDEETFARGIHYYLDREEHPSFGFSPDAEFPIIHAEKGILRFFYRVPFTAPHTVIKVLSAGTRLNVVPDEARALLALDQECVTQAASRAGLSRHCTITEEAEGCLLTVTGLASHASYPQEGKNAIQMLFQILSPLLTGDHPADVFLRTMADRLRLETNGESFSIGCSDETSGALTINPAVLSFSDEELTLKFDIRYPVTSDSDLLLQKLQEQAERAGASYELIQHKPPLYVEKDRPFIRKMQEAYTDFTGEEARLISIGGGTYCRYVPNTVSYGPVFPGQKEMAHQADEFISLEDLRKIAKIYAQTIYNLIA